MNLSKVAFEGPEDWLEVLVGGGGSFGHVFGLEFRVESPGV